MCGIYCEITAGSRAEDASGASPERIIDLIQRRGPDSFREHEVSVHRAAGPPLTIRFASTVLALRGKHVTVQPLVNITTGSVLCWNGEAWTKDAIAIAGNDSRVVFDALLHASQISDLSAARGARSAVVRVLSIFRGPFAFVFYDAIRKLLFFARDCLGRRSLVRRVADSGNFVLASVCDDHADWAEVEADGVYVIDLSTSADMQSSTRSAGPMSLVVERVSYSFNTQNDTGSSPSLQLEMNKAMPTATTALAEIPMSIIDGLYSALQYSLALRCINIRAHAELQVSDGTSEPRPAAVAVLFSGGLDCTVLARVLHDVLPASSVIDLLNVAFENPRVHGQMPAASSPFEACPDRITANKSYSELRTVCAGRRWNLVKVNVPYSETVAHRATVRDLIRPHNTEMDFSIACALYFASRGEGIVEHGDARLAYSTPSRVLLSGLGADELFGGYQRHATTFDRRGFPGLVDELALDVGRLGKRNLGRDDRVMSHWGKEVRFPFLDEELVSWALTLSVWEKCGFGLHLDALSDESLPSSHRDKRILRLLAWSLGMRGVAAEKKRAVGPTILAA